MTFITYENYQNRHITIHKFPCSQISKNGGMENYNEFGDFDTAQNYALKTGLPVNYCSFCKCNELAKGSDNDADGKKQNNKWAVYTFHGNYPVIHRTDCALCPDGNWQRSSLFSSADDAEAYAKIEVACAYCQQYKMEEHKKVQDVLRREQATDLPSIIGRIVMEKTKMIQNLEKAEVLYKLAKGELALIEYCVHELDRIQNSVAKQGFINDINHFNTYLDNLKNQNDYYEEKSSDAKYYMEDIEKMLLQQAAQLGKINKIYDNE